MEVSYTMNIHLKRQTSWGCVRHFSIYKNGIAQGKLFNNIPVDLAVEPGDILEFKEGLFYTSQKITITSASTEILITNTNRIQHLFYLFIFLFLTVSLVGLYLASIKIFLMTEISTLFMLNLFFRYRSYLFQIDPGDTLPEELTHLESYKQKAV
jgi:hypothetical protein